MIIKTVEYTLPVYWASYLVNNDPTGLEEGEQEEIDAFIGAESENKGLWCIDVSENSYFCKYNDANSLGGDVAEYTFQLGSD